MSIDDEIKHDETCEAGRDEDLCCTCGAEASAAWRERDALRAEVERLRALVVRLTDSLERTSDTLARAGDHMEACERERAEGRAEIERLRAERDNAREYARQLERVLDGTVTTEDAASLFVGMLTDEAMQAPNFAEWRGEWKGRDFALSVQWLDGKSPHELLDEARAESQRHEAEAASLRELLSEEREACAKLCDEQAAECREREAIAEADGRDIDEETWDEMADVAEDCARTIRARGVR